MRYMDAVDISVTALNELKRNEQSAPTQGLPYGGKLVSMSQWRE